MRTVVILAFEGVHLLDVAGPAAAFADVEAVLGRPAYRVRIASARGGTVAAVGGIGLATEPVATIAERPDTVVVPGGVTEAALAPVIGDRRLRAWLRDARPRRVASVCTGAFVLAAWGCLSGRRAATHWQATDRLSALHADVRVDSDALFVEDCGVWTSAGVSTGIDMALAMIERDHGRAVTGDVARRLVLHARRPGHQSQFSDVLAAQAGPYRALADWIGAHLDADLGVEALAARAGQSARTFHRRFTAAVGRTPAAYVERLRVARAGLLLQAGTPQKRVAEAVGLVSQARLARAFRRTLGLTPATYLALNGRAGALTP